MRFKAAVLSAVVSASAFTLAPKSAAQVLFTDNFDDLNSEFTWTVNKSGGDSFADFTFNYANLGIPSAPNSTGGSTIGLQFLVNQSAGVQQGISASPFDQHFTGDFQIRFDLWINFVGPAPLGGSGSTQMASFGWGTSGTTTQWAGANHSIVYAASGDGGTTQDYRAYLAAGGATVSPTTGFYSAGTISDQGPNDARNNSNVYYGSLGGKTIPSAQTALFASQTGTTAVGALGFAWRDVIIEKNGDVVSWSIDGLPIAAIPVADLGVLGGDNIFLGMFDINNGSSTDTNDFLNAAIYDNVRVQVIPEPASASLLALAAVGLCARRRRVA